MNTVENFENIQFKFYSEKRHKKKKNVNRQQSD